MKRANCSDGTSSNCDSPRAGGPVFRFGRWNPLILFVLGCGLGHWHGHLWNNAKHSDRNAIVNNDDEIERMWMTLNEGKRVLGDPSTPLATGGNGDRQQQDHDGWRVIHVFCGMSDHRDGDSLSTQSTHTAESPSAMATSIDVTDVERRRSLDAPDATQLHPTLHHQPLEHPWHSQARQDELVVALLGNKTNGYFIDLAANDAVQLSNTYALERFYHWKGVCIEPNPMYWYNLTAFRTCVIIGAVVGDQRMQGNEASHCCPAILTCIQCSVDSIGFMNSLDFSIRGLFSIRSGGSWWNCGSWL
jgi:hypothetical protein